MDAGHTTLPIGQQVSLPGHFALPVTLEAAHPGAQGYECRVRLPDGTLEETTISRDEAANLVAKPPKAKPATPHGHRPALHLQPEIPLGLPGQSELPLAQKSHARKRKTIQDVLLPEGLLAVKLSAGAKSPVELQELLVTRLGQNSMETRRRYAQSILKWFFPDGVDGILPRTWRAYQDEAIVSDFLRWSYLTQETVMGRCVAEALFPLENGLTIPATYFDKFLQDILGEAPPEKTRERLKSNLKKLGFLERAKGKAIHRTVRPVESAGHV